MLSHLVGASCETRWIKPSQSSLFLARAFNAQRRLWASLKAFGCDFISAPHALTIGPVLNSRQRAHHGSDVTRDERSLSFQWNVLLHLDRLFREIGIERLSQALCDAVLPFFEFHKLRLELSFCCEWDPEHGLGVLYRDWCVVEIGGWDL